MDSTKFRSFILNKLELIKRINLKGEYRANMLAQAISFIINCSLYYITDSQLFIWIAISCIAFIGRTGSQPANSIIDKNLAHQLLIILIYYLTSVIAIKFHFTYFILIFIFTYVFFILKGSGYDKSLTIWTYIQAFMIISALTGFPFLGKILGTLIAFVEAQLVLFIAFKIYPSPITYVEEPPLNYIKQLSKAHWLNPALEKVQLAIRGTLTAGILYILCVTVISNDVKPNWAVVATVSCLFRNDNPRSISTIISIAISSVFGFILSEFFIRFLEKYPSIVIFCLWISLMLALIFMFEYTIVLTYKTQILGITFMICTLTFLYTALNLDSLYYLHLKMLNNILAIITATIALIVWIIFKKLYALLYD